MKLESITLNGWVRTRLSNISQITLTPESIYQIILGTNGSGKSSLLSELSVLPGTKNDFSSGGFKEVVVTHNHRRFRLRSVFKSAAKHSFVRDPDEASEEELNPGGTASVQNELIKQEFGYTQELHQLLIGKVLFTDMTPAQRRSWITYLSPADMSYAMGVFKKLKTVGRDTTGAYKHISQRISAETNKLMDLEDVEGLGDRVRVLQDELTTLTEHKDLKVHDVSTARDRLEGLLHDIEALGRTIASHRARLPKGMALTPGNELNELRERTQGSERDVEVMQARLNHLHQEHGEMENIFRAIEAAGAGNLEELEERRYRLEGQIQEARSKITHHHIKGVSTAREMEYFLGEIRFAFKECVMALQPDPEREYGPDKVQQVTERKANAARALEKLNGQIARQQHRLDHIEGAFETTCPECGHAWKEGIGKEEAPHIKEWMEKAHGKAEEIETHLKTFTGWLSHAEEYESNLRSLRRLMADTKILRPLWNDLLKDDTIYTNPQQLLVRYSGFEQDVVASHALNRAEEEKEGVVEIINTLQQKDYGSEHFTKRARDLEGQIQTATDELGTLRRRAQAMRSLTGQFEELIAMVERMTSMVKEAEQARDQMVDAIHAKEVDGVIREHQNTLAILNHRLNEKTTLENIVDDLKRSRDGLSLDAEAYQLLTEVLSPTEGIIAEQLMGAIESITGHINSIIESIWTYPLYVLPCSMEDGELDCKFPIQFGSADDTTDDIKDGSTAQKEIINFAFKVVVYAHLEMHDWPIYLDELGHSFDEQHRVNVMSYLKQLVDANAFSQMFLVSHYASNHGGFTNADVCVLDGTNISVPQRHNVHVNIQ